MKELTMNIPLRNIAINWPSIQKLAECELLPGAALRYARFIRSAMPEYEEFEKRRKTLVEQYGEINSEGNTVVKNENLADFSEAVESMLDDIVEVTHPHLTIDDVNNVKGLSAYHYFGLLWLFDDETQTNEND